MKKQIFYLATAVIASGLTACSNDELDGNYAGVKLESNQLIASVPASTATRVGISEGEGSSYKLSWVENDAFGVFGAKKANENKKFTYKAKVSGEGEQAVITAVFEANSKVNDATYAYYPYEEGEKEVYKNNTLDVTLGGEFQWEDGVVKAPMFGLVSEGTSVSFKALTALLKVTVSNMPAGKTSASLYSYGTDGTNGEPLFGDATISKFDDEKADDATLTLNDDVTGNTKITYNFSASAQGDSKTFYFVIPAGSTYTKLVFALDGDYEEGSDPEKSSKVFASVLTSPAKATVYEKTIRYTENGEVEDQTIAGLNDKLAALTSESHTSPTSVSLANIKSDATIILPTTSKEDQWGDDNSNLVTITLTNIPAISDGTEEGTKAPTITVTQDDPEGYAPKNIKIVADVKSGNTDNVNFVIDLPHSTVELAPSTAKTTYPQVTSNTAENTLIVGANLTITQLNIKGGNVLVKDKGGVTNAKRVENSDDLTYIFYAASDAIEVNTENDELIQVEEQTIYNLISGAAENVKLSKDFTLNQEVTYTGTASIDLNGNTLTIGSKGNINVATGASLTIKTTSTGLVAEKENVVSTNSAAAINVEGGTLIVDKGVTIDNTTGGAIAAEDGTITLTDAVINGDITTSKSDSGNGTVVTFTKATVTGDVTLTGTTTFNSATDVTIEGDVTLDGAAAAAASFKSITGNVNIENAGSLALTAGAIVGNVKVDGATLTLTGGSIKPEAGVAIAASNSAEVTFAASGTTEVVSADAEAITINGGATVTVNSGTITGETAAVKVVDGKLSVPTGDTNTAAFTGEKTIIAENATKKKAIVDLEAAKATYKSTDEYVIYNHNDSDNALEAKLTINGGKFTGDVISDNTKYFIYAGTFTSANNLYDKQATYVNYGSDVTVAAGGIITVAAKE